MSTVKITQADWDRVWLELAELRQSLNARQIAPTPDYRSDLPADEPCSCEESERLKAELGEAHVRAQELESERDVARQGGATLRRMLSQQEHESRRLERQLAAANALLREYAQRTTHWSDDLPLRVDAHLSGQPAAPARADAEQRVLDAWKMVPDSMLHMWAKHPSEVIRVSSLAELARRGHG